MVPICILTEATTPLKIDSSNTCRRSLRPSRSRELRKQLDFPRPGHASHAWEVFRVYSDRASGAAAVAPAGNGVTPFLLPPRVRLPCHVISLKACATPVRYGARPSVTSIFVPQGSVMNATRILLEKLLGVIG